MSKNIGNLNIGNSAITVGITGSVLNVNRNLFLSKFLVNPNFVFGGNVNIHRYFNEYNFFISSIHLL